ncbi:MAG TPA: cytochrome b N-terminal domain-containing protein [Candidatus Angelobacter sp.]|nr:cytochrome b N-terminal domain-containing protein [Candidatus Angelobacter sp.]
MPTSPPATPEPAVHSPWIALARWRDEFNDIFSARVRERQLGFRLTWYLGALTLGTFAIQVITGILLMLYYHPSIPQAYADMKDLQFVISSGVLLRNLHRWSAHAMVFLVFMHMAKVFFRGAYRPPRELNWALGVCLLLLTLLLSYTGYLLPWDQLSYWGITVGSNIMSSIPLIGDKLRFTLLGGHTVNANALLRFYVLHTMILPLTAILLIAIHLWRLHQDGGMYAAGAHAGPPTPPASSSEEPTFSYRELLGREIIGIEVLATVLILIALRWSAPLDQLADPLHTPNPAKAPWYFTGLQELLHFFPPFVAGIILPGLVVMALIVIPFFNVNIRGENPWKLNKSRRLAMLGTILAVLTVVFIRFHAWDPLIPVWIVSGLMFFAAQNSNRTGPGFRAWLGSRPISFWIMTWFLMEAVTLTAVGTFLRGPGWSLVWPWSAP